MTFVLDASATLACYFDDEQPDYAQSLLLRLENEAALVPQTLWHLEVANALALAERRGD